MSTAKRYTIAAIIINYNSGEYTCKCVDSILEKTNPELNYQIVVVDNASAKENYFIVKNHLEALNNSRITLIRSNINLGFGSGNNLGVTHANADYYAFINNDSLLLNDCLSLIIREMETNPNMGICGPMAYKEDGSLLPTLDHFASPVKEFLGRNLMEKINPKRWPNRKTKYTKPQQGEFIAGSFMLVRASDFETVGRFDPTLFLYYEETDLCLRLQKINKFAFLIPQAEFIHYHGVSTPQSAAIRCELRISYLYVIRKHYGAFWHFIILNKLRLQFFLKSIFKAKNRPVFQLLRKGAPVSDSLRFKQKEVPV